MSRIGRSPIKLPEGVTINILPESVEIQGPKGSLSKRILRDVKVKVEDGYIVVEKIGNSKFIRSYYGTARQVINNMVEGVTKGFQKTLELVGIGYKASQNGKNLVLSLGYSHPINIESVEGVELKADGNKVLVSGIDKELVGLVAAKIKSKRKPDAYKGKGVRYAGETIKLKEGKKSK